VVATGKIQPLSKVEIKSKASGIVKKLYVDYGEWVKQGQLLAELDKVQLEAAERASRANLQCRRGGAGFFQSHAGTQQGRCGRP